MRTRNGQTTKGEKLSEYESVRNWFESLEASALSKGKGLSRRSRLVRLRALQEYVQLNGLTPDELLAGARADAKDATTRLTNFFNWLQGSTVEGVKPRTTHVSWNAAGTSQAYLRGFYTHNDLTFPKRFKSPAKRISECSKRDTKTAIYDYDESSDEIIYKNGALQHFLSNLGFRDQTIALCLFSTGADAADLLDLNVGFVEDDKGKISSAKRFLWKGNRMKDGIEFKTFFSEEATQFLKRYVEQERGDAKDKDALFIKEDGTRVNQHALAMNFRLGASKFLKVDSFESNPFRPKRFRHLFRSACANAHVDSGFVFTFMGHASNVSASYLEKSDGLFLREYVKVEPYITVFGVQKNGVIELAGELEELKTQVQEKERAWGLDRDKALQTMSEASRRLSEKEYEISELRTRVGALEAQNTEITASISYIKKNWRPDKGKFIDTEPIQGPAETKHDEETQKKSNKRERES